MGTVFHGEKNCDTVGCDRAADLTENREIYIPLTCIQRLDRGTQSEFREDVY